MTTVDHYTGVLFHYCHEFSLNTSEAHAVTEISRSGANVVCPATIKQIVEDILLEDLKCCSHHILVLIGQSSIVHEDMHMYPTRNLAAKF